MFFFRVRVIKKVEYEFIAGDQSRYPGGLNWLKPISAKVLINSIVFSCMTSRVPLEARINSGFRR